MPINNNLLIAIVQIFQQLQPGTGFVESCFVLAIRDHNSLFRLPSFSCKKRLVIFLCVDKQVSTEWNYLFKLVAGSTKYSKSLSDISLCPHITSLGRLRFAETSTKSHTLAPPIIQSPPSTLPFSLDTFPCFNCMTRSLRQQQKLQEVVINNSNNIQQDQQCQQYPQYKTVQLQYRRLRIKSFHAFRFKSFHALTVWHYQISK